MRKVFIPLVLALSILACSCSTTKPFTDQEMIESDLTLSEINATLKIINEKYTDYTTKNQWYRRKLNRFKKSGLSGLYNNQLCTVTKPSKKECFKFYAIFKYRIQTFNCH